jgi:hypothetical protein
MSKADFSVLPYFVSQPRGFRNECAHLLDNVAQGSYAELVLSQEDVPLCLLDHDTD